MPPSVRAEFKRAPISSIAAIIASCCALATLLTGIWLAAEWTTTMEERLAYNERNDQRHHEDGDLHMSYHSKVKEFPTRAEFDVRGEQNRIQFQEIKASALRTENKIDKIYDILREK